MTLAGGLIRVGHDVLYNANTGPYSPALGTHYLQYDHFAHAYVSFVIVFACWFMLAAPHAGRGRRGELVLLAVGAALGLGALNEMVEFIATLAHHGAHAGGYWNTGWDLVANFTGATAAGLVLARFPRRVRHDQLEHRQEHRPGLARVVPYPAGLHGRQRRAVRRCRRRPRRADTGI